MANYLKAELYRLVRNKGNYKFYLIILLIATLLLALVVAPGENVEVSVSASEEIQGISSFYFQGGAILIHLAGMLVIGGQSFYTVYLDDYSNHTLATTHATGLSKTNFIIAKFIAQAIYTFVVFTLMALLFISGIFLYDIFVQPVVIEMMDIALFAQVAFIGYVLTLAFSQIVHAISLFFQRSDFSLITFAIFITGISVSIVKALSNIKVLEFLRPVSKFFLHEPFSDFFSQPWGAENLLSNQVWLILATAVVYTVVGILLAHASFKVVEIKE